MDDQLDMMKRCSLTLPLNLQRMATVRLAVSLWGQSHITERIKDFFPHYQINDNEREYEWEALTKEVIQSIPEVPDVMQERIELAVRSVGGRLYNFNMFVGGKAINYAVHWTHYGCIDELPLLRVFSHQSLSVKNIHAFWSEYQQMSWLKSKRSLSYFRQSVVDDNVPKSPAIRKLKLLMLKEKYETAVTTWNVLDDKHKTEIGEVKLGDFIGMTRFNVNDPRQDNIPKTAMDHLKLFLIHDMYNAVNHFWYKLNDEEKSEFAKVRLGDLMYTRRFYNNIQSDVRDVRDNIPKSLPMGMLKSLMGQGNYIAVKCYWNGMIDEEKSEIAEAGLRELVVMTGNSVKDYRYDRFIELGMFLIDAMTDSQRERFFRKHGVSFMFQLWLTRWPWIELLVPTLASMWQHITKSTYTDIINEIVTAMKNDFYSGYGIKDSLNQRILLQIWEETPADLKRSIPYRCMATLISIFDYASYQLISRAFEEKELLKEHEKFLDSLREANYISDPQISEHSMCFENKIDTLGLYLNISQYELADKLLDWKSCTEEEKRDFKYFEPELMYTYFISKGKHFEAEKVFKWRFTVRESITS